MLFTFEIFWIRCESMVLHIPMESCHIGFLFFLEEKTVTPDHSRNFEREREGGRNRVERRMEIVRAYTNHQGDNKGKFCNL